MLLLRMINIRQCTAPHSPNLASPGAQPHEPSIRPVNTASLAAAALLCGCAAQPAPPTVSDVVAMSREGVQAAVIIDKMRKPSAVYRLPGSAFAALKDDGVTDPVLDYMLQTYLRAERERQAQFCTMGPPYDVIP